MATFAESGIIYNEQKAYNTIEQMKNQVLAERAEANRKVTLLLDASELYGGIKSEVNHCERILVKLTTMSNDTELSQDFRDSIVEKISLLTTLINNLKTNYTNNVYNIINGD